MATAAFKSTSRRPNSSSSETRGRPTSPVKNTHSSNKPPPRRSRSVSAAPRPHLDKIPSLSSSATDFSNKRDNPLYWTNSSPPDKESFPEDSKFDSSGADSTRGRSVSRNVEPKVDTGRPRSVSRGPAGRSRDARSVSRGPVGRSRALNSEVRSVSRDPVGRTQPLNSESDAQGVNLLTRYRNGSDSDGGSSVGGKGSSVRSYSHVTPGKVQNLSGSPVILMPNASWEDKVLGSLFSEGDRRCEQRKSFQEYGLEDDASSCIYETVRSEVRRAIADIQNDLESAIIRSNGNPVTSAGVVDLPPDLVNPGAVELVLDIRREYTRKLEQSQEQARKLRAELEVEEHRGLELARILKEVLPDPKTSMRRSRPGRKSSIERRKMSRRLTEEAIAYFDECISLSTFDSSDFDSQDEPPISVVGNSVHVGDDTFLSEASTSVAATQCLNSSPDYKQEWDNIGCNMSGMSATRCKQQTTDETGIDNLERRRDSMSRFSFGRIPSETLEFQHQIGEYVKNVERVPKIPRSKGCDMEEYNFEVSSDSLLFDTLILKNKIESGSIHVCGGGVTISLSPFAYVN